MTRPGFIPGYVPTIAHAGSASQRRLLWLSVIATWSRAVVGHRRSLTI